MVIIDQSVTETPQSTMACMSSQPIKEVVILAFTIWVGISYGHSVDGQTVNGELFPLQQHILKLDSAIAELQTTVRKQSTEINDLKKTMQDQSKELSALNESRYLGLSSQDEAADPQTSQVTAFSSYADTHLTGMAVGKVILFNRVLLNSGNGYDAATGIFTVPESGTYLFSFFVSSYYVSSSAKESRCHLLVDGQRTVDGIAETNGNDMNDQGGNVAILSLETGQMVWVANSTPNGIIENTDTARFSSFSGHKL